MKFAPPVCDLRADAAPSVPAPSALPAARAERVALAALLAVLLAARVLYVTRLPFDSDEAQHLHVASEWTRGHVQYRDVFDNHAPLFHLLVAPFLAAVGERADVQILARFAMFPLFAAMLVATGLLGRRLFGPRVGAWAAVLLGWHLEFFTTSLQFRTDDLWVVVWLLAVLVLFGGPASPRRSFAGGLLVGVAFAVSLKTSLLVASLAAAVLAARRLAPRPPIEPRQGRAVAGALAFAAGAAVVPAVLLGVFAALGAIGPLVDCTVRHSAFPLGNGGWRPWSSLLFAGAIVLELAAGIAFARSRIAPGDRRRQLAVLWGSGFAAAALLTVWPTSTPQDGMAILPGVFLAAAASACRLADLLVSRVARSRSAIVAGAVPAAALALLGAVCAARLVTTHSPFRDRTAASVADLDRLLRITDDADDVMDAKGEAIFRHRPFYYVLELFTKRRMRAGLIQDRIVDRCVETSTAYVFGSVGHFPAPDRRFFQEHFLGDGRVRVAGGIVRPPAEGAAAEFAVVIPGRYALLEAHGPAHAELDGTTYAGPRWLEPGPHRLVSAGARETAFVWAKAVDRGYRPFEEAGSVR